MNNERPAFLVEKTASGFTARCAARMSDAEFAAQRIAFRDARCSWDQAARGWTGPVASLGLAVEGLRAVGFAVEIPAALADAAVVPEAPAFEIVLPEGISLYPHQVSGVRWLRSRIAKGGGILADDMGLGKTAQVLLAADPLAPILVVCPAVAKGVWVRETAKFSPSRTSASLEDRGSFRWPTPGEVLAVNFDILPKTEKDARGFAALPTALLESMPKGLLLVVDEAHKIKNSKAQRTQALRAISYACRKLNGAAIELTGTPVMNSPREAWALLVAAGLQFETFGDLGYDGAMRLAGLVQGEYGGTFDRTQIQPEFARRLSRVVLRRKKADVLDLPAKRFETLSVDVSSKGLAAAKFSAEDLEALDAGRFLSFDRLSAARAALAKAKIPAALDLADDCEEQGEPALFFSAHLAPVEALAARPGWVAITGDVPASERAEIERRFQAGEIKGIAATITSAGVALTLTRASRVVFVDLDWTPANNEQAVDRAHRIGQERSILVTTIVANHPVDQHVARLLAFKGEIVAKTTDAIRPASTPALERSIAAALKAEGIDAVSIETVGAALDALSGAGRDEAQEPGVGSVSEEIAASGATVETALDLKAAGDLRISAAADPVADDFSDLPF